MIPIALCLLQPPVSLHDVATSEACSNSLAVWASDATDKKRAAWASEAAYDLLAGIASNVTEDDYGSNAAWASLWTSKI